MIYYEHAPYGKNIDVLYYVDDWVYWYTSEALGKWFVDTLGKNSYMNLFGYSHWFMPIIISQMKYHSISVDQDIYDTSVVDKYLGNATIKAGTKVFKTTFPSDIIFTQTDVSNSDE